VVPVRFAEFVGQLQHRLELPGEGEAVRAARATLTTLGERLQSGEADDLASSLPMEIDRFLRTADSGQRFPYEEFLDRVAEREGSDRSAAARHAAVVVGLVSEVTPAGEMAQVRGGLPAEYDPLFELVDEG
jgi:uncharacterized protein (DUF2267 family)